MRYHNSLTAIVLGVASGAVVVSRAFSAESSEKEVNDLVQALVSRNAEPPPPSPHVPYRLPSGFDERENRRCIAARDALLAKGIAAFPHLIEALDDSRYSYTEVSPMWATHLHVREVCLEIIRLQVEVYGGFMRPINEQLDRRSWLPVPPRGGFPRFFWPNGAKAYMQKWWSPRKETTLRDLQLEAVEWAIECEQGRGFLDKEEESLVLGWYRPLLTRLKSSKRPIRVGLNGQFLEENLKPKDSDWERWMDRWSDRWFGTRSGR